MLLELQTNKTCGSPKCCGPWLELGIATSVDCVQVFFTCFKCNRQELYHLHVEIKLMDWLAKGASVLYAVHWMIKRKSSL